MLCFCRGDEIVKKDEEVEFVGIIVHGGCYICHEYKNLKTLQIGDMIGLMYAAEFTQRNTHPYTVQALTTGIIAIIALSDIKAEIRRNPKEVNTPTLCL